MEIFLLIDSSSDEEEQIHDRNRRERIFLPRISVPRHASTFREEFRVDAMVAEQILNRIGHMIAHPTRNSFALTPREQLLTTLRFLGTNAPYHAICNMQGPHKSTVCRILHKVVHVLNQTIFLEHVRFPDNANDIPQQFQNMAGRFQ